MKQPLLINPPLLNSANPWATSFEDLDALYACPHTGAVTTRTALLDGFAHDDAVHQYTFFDPLSHRSTKEEIGAEKNSINQTSSLNTLGYSPIPLSKYLSFISEISKNQEGKNSAKPVIISVTGTPEEVVKCYQEICTHQTSVTIPLAMEINLSCPNIPNKPPPAYSTAALISYLSPLVLEFSNNATSPLVPIGLKLPPYTYSEQFNMLMNALLSTSPRPSPISFLTATNTLGTSLLLTPSSDEPNHYTPTLAPEAPHHSSVTVDSITGLGGMAGSALHPLALGNVYSLRRHLFRHPELEHIQIIGVGGVEDAEGYNRMRAAGAAAVAVGTAFGRRGLSVFADIAQDAGMILK
jgi:dihydroorotate dehydrogenase (fumarate)